MRSAVVFNPTKAGKPDKVRRQIREALLAKGFADPLWLETTAADPGTGQCRRALDDGAEIVFVSGGDGTVMACAQVLAGTDVALALLPAGTGNLLARNLGVPRDLAGAVAVAASGVRRRIDVGVAGDRKFLIMAGMGFDAQMLDGAPAALKSTVGWPAYVVSALRHLREPRHTFTLTIDGGPSFERRGRGVLVGNVGRLQGGLPVLPDAVPDDGLLDVAIINTRGLGGWALLLGAVVLRRPDARRLETMRASRVTVRCSQSLPTELDGEVLEATDELDIAVLPGALTLMVPPG